MSGEGKVPPDLMGAACFWRGLDECGGAMDRQRPCPEDFPTCGGGLVVQRCRGLPGVFRIARDQREVFFVDRALCKGLPK
jgi:hypothetical protein